jgi:hypothetical protein
MDFEVFALRAVDCSMDQAGEFADAVVDVDDICAGRDFGYESFSVGGLSRQRSSLLDEAEDLVVRQEGDARQFPAL